MNRPLLIGLGNRWRGDDAVGPLVLEGLRKHSNDAFDLLESPGDSLALLNAWQGRQRVYLVDACCDSSQKDGSLVTIDNALENSSALRQLRHPTSSHLIDLEQAIAMGQALGNTPTQLTIYAVVASQFEAGCEVSAAVKAAARQLVRQLSAVLAQQQTQQQAG